MDREEFEARKRAAEERRMQSRYWFSQPDATARMTGWLALATFLMSLVAIAQYHALDSTDKAAQRTLAEQQGQNRITNRANIMVEAELTNPIGSTTRSAFDIIYRNIGKYDASGFFTTVLPIETKQRDKIVKDDKEVWEGWDVVMRISNPACRPFLEIPPAVSSGQAKPIQSGQIKAIPPGQKNHESFPIDVAMVTTNVLQTKETLYISGCAHYETLDLPPQNVPFCFYIYSDASSLNETDKWKVKACQGMAD